MTHSTLNNTGGKEVSAHNDGKGLPPVPSYTEWGSIHSRTTSREEIKPICENRINSRKVTHQHRETSEGQAECKLFFLKMYYFH